MAELPSGTVSLLFSDIEGSTALLSRLGPAYADALDGQRQVLRRRGPIMAEWSAALRATASTWSSRQLSSAVAAAAQAQRELAAFDWPGGEQVRVRMGIHTGSPTVHGGDYVGLDVHRAARIAGSAHGGQVVISSATAELVEGRLVERLRLRDLGSHQLKDIAQPERLYQLVIEGLPSDFAPLKTLGAATSLPRVATPLVGREGELAELLGLLGSSQVVTLTGPGGPARPDWPLRWRRSWSSRFRTGCTSWPLQLSPTPM
ncbi:MAG: adenylate/guanylate cyclase domain-containing protein [Nocardioidaceae bacterium]